MNEMIIQLLSALVATLGFAILFSVAPRHLPLASLSGVIAWAICLAFSFLGDFAANAISAFCITLFCEAVARWKKAPVITFLTPSVIVLVPGRLLYHTILHILLKESTEAMRYGTMTLNCCLGIAAGILLSSFLITLLQPLYHRFHR